MRVTPDSPGQSQLRDAPEQASGVRPRGDTPFGLKTDYDDPWIGRFRGLKSELRMINVNPAIC